MTGTKGKSGGARRNAGGARVGAGRKPKEAQKVDGLDPLKFLLAVMEGRIDPSPAQMRAAITAAQYVNTRTHDGTKKERKSTAAKRASKGRFSPAPMPPKLVVNR
jgi:phage terminase small subunit